MSSTLMFDPIRLPEPCQILRREVREFLGEETAKGSFDPRFPWRGEAAADKAFAKRIAEKGWIGMTWPKKYGGRERSFLERYVVLEELLGAGAPVAAHWMGDRQSGPLL